MLVIASLFILRYIRSSLPPKRHLRNLFVSQSSPYFASNNIIEQITSTFHEALKIRGEPVESLSVMHEGLSLGGSVDRYLFTVGQGDVTVDFYRLPNGQFGVDRMAVESRPDTMRDPNLASNLSAKLELYPDNSFLAWDHEDGAESVVTLGNLLDMLHILARFHHQMQDTAKFIQHTTLARHGLLNSA